MSGTEENLSSYKPVMKVSGVCCKTLKGNKLIKFAPCVFSKQHLLYSASFFVLPFLKIIYIQFLV